jgi:hypothetical protein
MGPNVKQRCLSWVESVGLLTLNVRDNGEYDQVYIVGDVLIVIIIELIKLHIIIKEIRL